eukprot:13453698-Alexandrium_andersonii.AAC.1
MLVLRARAYDPCSKNTQLTFNVPPSPPPADPPTSARGQRRDRCNCHHRQEPIARWSNPEASPC